MRSRSQAVQTQIEELWKLNQVCDTDFDHLANAVKHAYERDYSTTTERDRLDMVNKAGNDAKHKGLGSRSRSVTPVRSAARATARAAARKAPSAGPTSARTTRRAARVRLGEPTATSTRSHSTSASTRPSIQTLWALGVV